MNRNIARLLLVVALVLVLPSLAAGRMSNSDFLNLCCEGTPAEVQAAIEAGAQVRFELLGYTPLHMAVLNNPNPEVITLLLMAGADAKARDMFRKRPIDYAKEKEHLKGTAALEALRRESAMGIVGIGVCSAGGSLIAGAIVWLLRRRR